MWLLDLGNTRLKLAWATPDGLGPATALPHAESGFEARLAEALSVTGPGEVAWLASVASPPVRQRVEALLDARGLRVVVATTRSACAGLTIAYSEPSRLGVDRFLALLAARWRGGDHLVASFGSALTVDLLDAEGRHHGGLIGIAPAHARAALRERFPALDRGDGVASVPWATDTPDAVAAGVQRQATGFVLAAWHDACARLGRPPGLLLGGGDAGLHVEALRRGLGPIVDIAVSDTLVLEGLWRYAGAMAP